MDFVTPFINFLLQSDYIKNSKLFLNAGEIKDGNKQIVTQQIDKLQDVEYIDGSVRHTITFTINDYHSISFNPLNKIMISGNENITDLLDVQKINEFISQCDKSGVYPDFGENYVCEKIECAYSTPSTPVIDATASPPVARYFIPIVCYVLDRTDAIW